MDINLICGHIDNFKDEIEKLYLKNKLSFLVYDRIWLTPVDDNGYVVNKVHRLLSSLRDDISYCIEYPFSDSLYRDSYYNHYSKKHHEYSRDCVRVSFFDTETLTLEKIVKDKNIANNFLGYIVLRPIFNKQLGRTFLSPKVFKNLPDFISCKYTEKIQISGVEFNVDGFPHCPQDSEYITCSEVSIWCVMEYYSAKYRGYGTILPSNIKAAAKRKLHQRHSPSNGLDVRAMSYTLGKFGFGARLYSTSNMNMKSFRQTLNDYVESGICVVFINKNISNGNLHSQVIIGHEIIANDIVEYIESARLNTFSFINPTGEILNKITFYDSGLYNGKKYITSNDTQLPYHSIDIEDRTMLDVDMAQALNFKSKSEVNEILEMIVPLASSVHLEPAMVRHILYANINGISFFSRTAKKAMQRKIENAIKNFPQQLIVRVLLASNQSFKAELRKEYGEVIPDRLREKLIRISLPKFIFICELTTVELAKDIKCLSILLIDATATNTTSPVLDNVVLAFLFSDILQYKKNDIFAFLHSHRALDEKEEIVYNMYTKNLIL